MAARKLPALKRSTSAPTKVDSTLIHEVNEKGQHRIASFATATAKGEWAAHTEIASLGGYRATTDHFKGLLPQGIFLPKEVVHLTL